MEEETNNKYVGSQIFHRNSFRYLAVLYSLRIPKCKGVIWSPFNALLSLIHQNGDWTESRLVSHACQWDKLKKF